MKSKIRNEIDPFSKEDLVTAHNEELGYYEYKLECMYGTFTYKIEEKEIGTKMKDYNLYVSMTDTITGKYSGKATFLISAPTEKVAKDRLSARFKYDDIEFISIEEVKEDN
jgi:hypothetical protein